VGVIGEVSLLDLGAKAVGFGGGCIEVRRAESGVGFLGRRQPAPSPSAKGF